LSVAAQRYQQLYTRTHDSHRWKIKHGSQACLAHLGIKRIERRPQAQQLQHGRLPQGHQPLDAAHDAGICDEIAARAAAERREKLPQLLTLMWRHWYLGMQAGTWLGPWLPCCWCYIAAGMPLTHNTQPPALLLAVVYKEFDAPAGAMKALDFY
jgi:hypothetical protein